MRSPIAIKSNAGVQAFPPLKKAIRHALVECGAWRDFQLSFTPSNRNIIMTTAINGLNPATAGQAKPNKPNRPDKPTDPRKPPKIKQRAHVGHFPQPQFRHGETVAAQPTKRAQPAKPTLQTSKNPTSDTNLRKSFIDKGLQQTVSTPKEPDRPYPTAMGQAQQNRLNGLNRLNRLNRHFESFAPTGGAYPPTFIRSKQPRSLAKIL